MNSMKLTNLRSRTTGFFLDTKNLIGYQQNDRSVHGTWLREHKVTVSIDWQVGYGLSRIKRRPSTYERAHTGRANLPQTNTTQSIAACQTIGITCTYVIQPELRHAFYHFALPTTDAHRNVLYCAQ